MFKVGKENRNQLYKHSMMVNNKNYRQDDKTIPFSVADMDFLLPQFVQDDLIDAIKHNTFGYTFPRESYYQALNGFMARWHNFEVNKDDVFLMPGVIEGIAECLDTFTEKNDGVIIFTPVYHVFKIKITNCHRQPVECPLIYKDNRYSIDFDHFEQLAQQSNNKVLLFCSPHNPVGRVWTETELLKLGNICKKYNILIISDEIHHDLILFNHRHIVLANLFPEITITLTAPTKTFNMAAIQIANMIVKDINLKNKISVARKTNGYGHANALGFIACESAYKNGDEWVKSLRKLVEHNFLMFKEKFPSHMIVDLEGTYLMWLDCTSVREKLDKLDEHQIFVNEGKMFGGNGDNFIRINLACSPEYIQILIERLTECFT